MGFEKLNEKIRKTGNPTVMGLDPAPGSVPEFLREGRTIGEALFAYNKGLIDAVSDLIPAVKPQSAFYELYGLEGMTALEKTIRYAKQAGLYVILDVKRGDIGSTAAAYAGAFLGTEESMPDCVTVNGYLGYDGVKPFLDAAEASSKEIFVLVKTSNPSSGDFQELDCGGRPLYAAVADKVEEWGASHGISRGYSRCGAVVGATYPRQLAELRAAMPHTFLLIPGYGAQGGTGQDVRCAFDAEGGGAIVNSSRGLICAYQKHGDPENFQKHTREAVLAMRADLTGN